MPRLLLASSVISAFFVLATAHAAPRDPVQPPGVSQAVSAAASLYAKVVPWDHYQRVDYEIQGVITLDHHGQMMIGNSWVVPANVGKASTPELRRIFKGVVDQVVGRSAKATCPFLMVTGDLRCEIQAGDINVSRKMVYLGLPFVEEPGAFRVAWIGDSLALAKQRKVGVWSAP